MEPTQFKNQIANRTVLVNFNARWCAPCKAMAPILQRLEARYADLIAVQNIDIDSAADLATRYMVQSIPTLILFSNGEELARFVGLRTEKDIADQLDALMSMYNKRHDGQTAGRDLP